MDSVEDVNNSHQDIPKKKRGRPPKVKTEQNKDVVKKPRGRPLLYPEGYKKHHIENKQVKVRKQRKKKTITKYELEHPRITIQRDEYRRLKDIEKKYTTLNNDQNSNL
jgi:hypothetical protein